MLSIGRSDFPFMVKLNYRDYREESGVTYREYREISGSYYREYREEIAIIYREYREEKRPILVSVGKFLSGNKDLQRLTNKNKEKNQTLFVPVFFKDISDNKD
jgi:hypothetical protein